MDLRSLFEFRDWIDANGCEAVAVESTGSYWVPIYRVLEGHVELIVANAYKIKNVPGRKTDTIDSEWIAELCRNGQINPSRIFPKDARDLRNLTRARERHIDDKTRVKNRIHHILDSNCIRLSSVLAAVALARKMLCVLHHLLTVQEMYQEEADRDTDVEELSIPGQRISLDDIIRHVTKAGYEVRKRAPRVGG